MKKLHFQIIGDSRNGKKFIKQADDELYATERALKLLEGVQVEKSQPRIMQFTDGTQQIRFDITVSKDRRTTWNDVMKAINSIKPRPYNYK